MLDDQQRITLFRKALERIEKNGVIARMQTDRGLIEDVAHALQIGSELRSQANTLGFATRQRGRRTRQLQISETHVFEECQT